MCVDGLAVVEVAGGSAGRAFLPVAVCMSEMIT